MYTDIRIHRGPTGQSRDRFLRKMRVSAPTQIVFMRIILRYRLLNNQAVSRRYSHRSNRFNSRFSSPSRQDPLSRRIHCYGASPGTLGRSSATLGELGGRVGELARDTGGLGRGC